jgi:hypothetical protein
MNNINPENYTQDGDWSYESKTSDQIKKEEEVNDFLSVNQEMKELKIKEYRFKLKDVLFKSEEEIDQCSREFYEFVYK